MSKYSYCAYALLWLLIMITLTTVFYFSVEAQTESNNGVVGASFSVRGTFLHADPYEEGREEGGDIEPPAIISLKGNGIQEEQTILISFEGYISKGGEGDLNKIQDLIGVFSTTDQLLPIYEIKRVPGAITSNSDKEKVTGTTYYTSEPTDIPEDFDIDPNTGCEIKVPKKAEYLFICDSDSYYPDNDGGPIQVNIEIDIDRDSLWESWETEGIDFDFDDEIDLDLPMLGADWAHKDIFVEADYMKGREPIQMAIDDVVASFAASGVENPDSVTGINLHVIIDEEVPFSGVLGSWGDFSSSKNKYFGTADERENVNTIQAKKLVFRYCLFANSTGFTDINCPGVAEGILCDDFILAFGTLDFGGTQEEQAAIFMHELGHTLGLRHGGNVDTNFKPNYLSIMNYAFQYDNWKPDRPLDYSHGSCKNLMEDSLIEPAGVGYYTVTVWRDPTGRLCISNGNLGINWDNDEELDRGFVKVNLNHNPSIGYPSPANEILNDFDDWNNLVYRFRGTPLSAASAIPTDWHDELTVDQIEQMREEAKTIVVVSPSEASATSDMPLGAIIAVTAAVIVIVAAFGIWKFKKRQTECRVATR